jgi:putative transposase
MQSAEQLGQRMGVEAACDALSVPRSSLYRARRPSTERGRAKISPRAFSQAEKIKVREELNSERFQVCAPREVYGTLLDEGQYLCSWRTLRVYRILAENKEVRERRNQLRHPNYSKPELLATGPNQLWSWDTPAQAPQVQVLPNCWDRLSGRITTCMSFWMCSAVTWLAG